MILVSTNLTPKYLAKFKISNLEQLFIAVELESIKLPNYGGHNVYYGMRVLTHNTPFHPGNNKRAIIFWRKRLVAIAINLSIFNEALEFATTLFQNSCCLRHDFSKAQIELKAKLTGLENHDLMSKKILISYILRDLAYKLYSKDGNLLQTVKYKEAISPEFEIELRIFMDGFIAMNKF